MFSKKASGVLNVYCTAGYPQLESTLTIMGALQSAGADIIELGMPYSDPLADGPVIQASGLHALENGMTISTLFEQLRNFRSDSPPLVQGTPLEGDGGGDGGVRIHLPVILMGYMNPVLQ